MQLSPHFSLAELKCKCGCETSAAILKELQATARFMETVRAYLGNRAITPSSGFRCSKHNTAIKGAKDSFHLKGYACDFTVAGLSPADVHRALSRENSPVAHSGLGSYKTFVHVDRRKGKARWSG
jgi:uncharacterized protein YcbK (DUF882 family)